MSLVPSTVAEWLTGRAIYAQAEDGGLRASWGEVALESEVLSPIAAAADAAAEANRQLAFLGQPIAEEDDWSAFKSKIDAVREYGRELCRSRPKEDQSQTVSPQGQNG